MPTDTQGRCKQVVVVAEFSRVQMDHDQAVDGRVGAERLPSLTHVMDEEATILGRRRRNDKHRAGHRAVVVDGRDFKLVGAGAPSSLTEPTHVD